MGWPVPKRSGERGVNRPVTASKKKGWGLERIEEVKRYTRLGAGTFFVLLGVVLCPYLLGYFIFDKAQKYEIFHSYVLVMSSGCFAVGILILFLEHLPFPLFWERLATVLGTLVLCELVLAVAVSKTEGVSHMGFFGNRVVDAFVFHPSVGGMPRPGYRYREAGFEISHTTFGTRGLEPGSRWDQARLKLVAVGGSTTYDLGLSDKDTWVAQINNRLKDDISIINYGVPGHTTAENIIVTSLILSEHNPNIILFYIGGNDIRNSHIANLRADYSDYHFLSQYGNLNLDRPFGFFAVSFMLSKLKLLLPTTLFAISKRADDTGTVSAEVDQRLAGIFERNIRLLVAVSRTIGAEPVFIPEVPNVKAFTSDQSGGWFPNIPHNAIPDIYHAFGSILVDTARELDAPVIDEVTRGPWEPTDFVDSHHFSKAGAARFAEIVVKGLERRKLIW